MTRRKNAHPKDDTCIKALLDAETPIITIVGKTWDMHVREVLGTTLDENVSMIADSVRYCVEQGREVFYDAEHFFDGFRHNPEYALRTLKAAEDAGATVVILCDTNGGTLPEEIAAAVETVRRHSRVELGIHCHNDSDVAVANTLAAVARGATQVQGTFNGIGERCGNVDLVSVIANLALKRGHDVLVPGSLAKLTEASRYVYETANMNFRSGQPFVGASAFAHKGGMHTHAVAKISSSYEHLDPALVGNERRILVSELSGQSTVVCEDQEIRPCPRPGVDGEDPEPGARPGKRRLRVRGSRGIVRSAGAQGGRAVSTVVRAAVVSSQHRDGSRTAPPAPKRQSSCAWTVSRSTRSARATVR